jgi:hypothetical protein
MASSSICSSSRARAAICYWSNRSKSSGADCPASSTVPPVIVVRLLSTPVSLGLNQSQAPVNTSLFNIYRANDVRCRTMSKSQGV